MSNSVENMRKFKVLVAIASYGDRQLDYLKQVIAMYRGMSMAIDIVVLSNTPKNLGDGVKVVVGLPSKNPHSLPFAHKPVLAENVDRYDIFVYTEDDIGITEAGIQAFLEVTRALPEDQIAGHLRYELDSSGMMWLPDIHGAFHWRPESVRMRHGHLFAEFTNEHTGFYLLTQRQLKRAMDSGGFLQAPYAGRYGMLEAAATDPFTRCGFRKVICISQLDNFLLHHMSNRYAGKIGVPRDIVNQQIRILADIQKGNHPASNLCELTTKMPTSSWSKDYYEQPREDILRLMPKKVANVLSIGCGWGATEALLGKTGARVTALPVDSVLGAIAAQRGIEVIYGTLEEGVKQLTGRKFDCVVMTNLLHLLPEQRRIMQICAELLQTGGTLLISGPNFGRAPTFLKLLAQQADYQKLRSYEQSGIKMCSPRSVTKDARDAGLCVTAIEWINHALPGRRLAAVKMELGRLTAKNWILRATR